MYVTADYLDRTMRENNIGMASYIKSPRKVMVYCAPYNNSQRFFKFLRITEQKIGRILESLYSWVELPSDEMIEGAELFYMVPERDTVSIYYHLPEIIARMECPGS